MNKHHISLIAVLAFTGGIAGNAQQSSPQQNLIDGIRSGNESVVREALDKGANANAPGELGRTPLHEAAMQCNSKIVALLLQRGAAVNATDDQKCTPLFWAVWSSGQPRTNQENAIKTINVLIANKANPNIANEDKETPRQLATKLGKKEVVEALTPGKKPTPTTGPTPTAGKAPIPGKAVLRGPIQSQFTDKKDAKGFTALPTATTGPRRGPVTPPPSLPAQGVRGGTATTGATTSSGHTGSDVPNR